MEWLIMRFRQRNWLMPVNTGTASHTGAAGIRWLVSISGQLSVIGKPKGRIQMTIAFWCVLAVLLAPYILSVAARSAVSRAEYVEDPRAYSEGLTGWRRRAHLAHLNAFEALPAIIAGVMVAEFANAPRNYIDALAVGFIVLRVLHAICYIADKPMLRSHAWRLAIICVLGMFVVAAVYGKP
jgi:uncharacterized MAPEG superfamily protein